MRVLIEFDTEAECGHDGEKVLTQPQILFHFDDQKDTCAYKQGTTDQYDLELTSRRILGQWVRDRISANNFGAVNNLKNALVRIRDTAKWFLIMVRESEDDALGKPREV